MIYPKYIKYNDTIGVCAPSDGINNKLKLVRVDNAYQKLQDKGFKIIETASVRKSNLGVSNSIKKRVEELESLYLNKDVSAIICATGGDFLMEILPYINYDIICNNIKWIQGYSDITGLLFTITTKYDIATIYGYNIGSYGMGKWHSSVTNSIELLKGNIDIQESLDYYEDKHYKYVTGFEGFHKDISVKWKCINSDNIRFSGRIIGGCLDCLINLIGTNFDNVKNFISKYKDDGIIWYFDCFDLSYENIKIIMWQLKENGWFKYCNGIIFGRLATNKYYLPISFEEILKISLNDLNIPIIWDADIGHKHPMLSIINGAYATISYDNGKGKIKQKLKK